MHQFAVGKRCQIFVDFGSHDDLAGSIGPLQPGGLRLDLKNVDRLGVSLKQRLKPREVDHADSKLG